MPGRIDEDLLELDDNGRPVYLHAEDCPSFCDYACNGQYGFDVAAKVDGEKVR